MSPKAQRIAIAEACGYFRMGDLSNGERHWGRTTDDADPFAANHFTFDGLPDYVADLNAMHEAEKVLDGKQVFRYRYYLIQLSNELPVRKVRDASEFKKLGKAMFLAFHATAAQRAEAFLRTLGKWDNFK